MSLHVLNATNLVNDFVLPSDDGELLGSQYLKQVRHWYRVSGEVARFLFETGIVPVILLSENYGNYIGTITTYEQGTQDNESNSTKQDPEANDRLE